MCLLVLFVKYLIIIVSSSLTISFYSTSEMLVELKHLKKMAEAATGGVSLKKVLLKILQNLQ